MPRPELTSDLAGSRSLDSSSAGELLARLEAEGLIRGEERVDLTAEGEALYRSLSEYVTGSAAERWASSTCATSRRPSGRCRPSPSGPRKRRPRPPEREART